jgi:hypothetical protein
MHRYRIIAQISLILSILNLALAAPIGVQETHEAPRGDETVVAEGMTSSGLTPPLAEGMASDGPTSPLFTPDMMESLHYSSSSSSLSDGSTSSGYPSPYVSSDKSVSGNSWM